MVLYVQQFIDVFTEIIKHCGPIMGFIIIILESIIPILPLAVFIGLNMIAFGPFAGFILSWTATVIGSILSFYAFRKGFSKKLYKHTKINSNAHKFMNYVTNIKFSQLVLISALPFTPAFAVNIAAGLSKISDRKFIVATAIAKTSIVYFWGYIATSFLESIQNPYILLKISVIMALAYFVSLVVQKLLKINGE